MLDAGPVLQSKLELKASVCFVHVEIAGFVYKWEKDEWDEIVGCLGSAKIFFFDFQATSFKDADMKVIGSTVEEKEKVKNGDSKKRVFFRFLRKIFSHCQHIIIGNRQQWNPIQQQVFLIYFQICFMFLLID